MILHNPKHSAAVTRSWVGAAALLILFSLSVVQNTVAENQFAEGRRIYNFRCYFCHGYSGDARTLAATFMPVQPRDFTSLEPGDLSRASMIQSVSEGRPGTAMTSFQRVLNPQEIESVVDFIRDEFMRAKAVNTTYHSAENGWQQSLETSRAYPFATGDLAVDTPWQELSEDQLRGKQLFLTTCITCHDRGRIMDEGSIWESQSLSYPRNQYSHKLASLGIYPLKADIDGVTSASIYAIHDVAPPLSNPSESEIAGRRLYQQNCAFCHAADGTGRNWIGSFLEPKPRDLTDSQFMQGMSKATIHARIANGLKGTSMPSWRGVLTDEQISLVVAYIAAAFHPLNSD